MTKVRCVKLDCKYNSDKYICKCKEIAFKDKCSSDGVMECKQYEKSQEFAKAEAAFLACMPNCKYYKQGKCYGTKDCETVGCRGRKEKCEID